MEENNNNAHHGLHSRVSDLDKKNADSHHRIYEKLDSHESRLSVLENSSEALKNTGETLIESVTTLNTTLARLEERIHQLSNTTSGHSNLGRELVMVIIGFLISVVLSRLFS